ncbi:hypothetical protein TrVE_jg7193 [Triparma verrucosa]|uniref:Limiting CO2-inducible protein B/C beta carbonyic anhydrase domain-containing protein n=1 Tax=Triparma verrucosa TaxID=1606542 RepID=A0A9W7F4A9_9STRA|nr:hypothetical protein TrVE_jg7193 [Triparma verrucosa]
MRILLLLLVVTCYAATRPPNVKNPAGMPKLHDMTTSAGESSAANNEHHQKLIEKFPGAMPASAFRSRVETMLKARGLDGGNTLLSTSFCCDEVNRSFERLLSDSLGGHSFNLGGLSGFPFAGSVGIGAMASHIPTGGHAVVIYGPHVGFSTADYAAGAVERSGIAAPNGCCGSAIAAMNSITAEHEESQRPGWFKRNPPLPPIIDMQQNHVQEQIKGQFDPEVGLSHDSLPSVAFSAITPDVDYLLGTGSDDETHKLEGKASTLVVIGGILVNTAPGMEDYFVPMRFELFDEGGKLKTNLLGEML